MYQVIHRTHGFLQRRLGIKTVTEVDVQVVSVKPAKASFHRLHNVFATQATVVDVFTHGPIQLTGEDEIAPPEIFDRSANNRLSFSPS